MGIRDPLHLKWMSISHRLKAVTIWDFRYEHHHRIPWSGVESVNGLTGVYDAMNICYWFGMMLDGCCPVHTINIYRSLGDQYEMLWESPLTGMVVGRSSATEKLFGDDTVYLVDLRDESEVKKVSFILSDEDSARTAVEAMERVHQDVQRNGYLYYSELLEHLKFLWLDTTYKWNKERGLPARHVEQSYYWHEGKRVFVCDNKNWSEDDPEIRQILEKMPKIEIVFVLVSPIR